MLPAPNMRDLLAAGRLLVLTLVAVTSLVGAPLRVCDAVEPPAHLNPLLVFAAKPDTIFGHLFDGLLEFDAWGKIQPGLARSWEWRDPRTLRMNLREGVRFHNGEVLDAEAVRWTFETMRSLGPRCARGFLFQHVEEVRALGAHEVELVLSRPDRTFLHRLAAFSWVLPPGASEALGMEGLGRDPIGTGPYRFAGWGPSGELRMAAHPGHWSGPPPFPEGIEWYFLPHAEQVRWLREGRLDLLTEVEPFYYRDLQESPDHSVLKADTLVAVNLMFNTLAGPAADRRLREAVARTVNRAQLIRYVARGNGRPIYGTSLPGQADAPSTRVDLDEFSPPAARSLLAELGPGPHRLRGLVDPAFVLLGKALRSQLGKVGIDLELVPATREELWRQVVLPRQRGEAPQDVDVFLFSTPDPTHHYFFMNSLVHPRSGPWNLWDHVRYDTLFEEYLRTQDDEAAASLVLELDRLVREERPVLFLYQVRKGYGLSDGTPFRPTMSGMLDLRAVTEGGWEEERALHQED